MAESSYRSPITARNGVILGIATPLCGLALSLVAEPETFQKYSTREIITALAEITPLYAIGLGLVGYLNERYIDPPVAQALNRVFDRNLK